MAHRNMAQIGFGDLLVAQKNINQKLDQIHQQIKWGKIENILSSIYDKTRGPKSFPPLLVFKCLLLQNWYDLSDYELEATLDDRLSFRKFVGLGICDLAPDHSTFSVFRKELSQRALIETVFQEINSQMEAQGVLVKKGTLVDATLVEAHVSKPSRTEDGKPGVSEVDQDARWVRKGHKRHFGYKGHIGVDMESGVIRKACITAANRPDGHLLPTLVSGDEDWIFADRIYESKKNKKYLAEQGIKNGMMTRTTRHRKATPLERLKNKLIAKRRYPVERVFATWKRIYHYRRVRYVGLIRNRLQFMLMCICYNLKKLRKLSQQTA